MYPFEVWNEEQQRIDFHFDRWRHFATNLFQQYPVQQYVPRAEIDLIFPSDRLEDIPVHGWNPHHEIGNHHLSVYDCFYESDEWSTIFEAYPAHIRITDGNESYRLFVEKGHQDPWGEPIKIMSTSSFIGDDTSHRYAYFRGKYWKIMSWDQHYFRPYQINWERLQETVTAFRQVGNIPPLPRPTRSNRNRRVNWRDQGF